MGRKPGRNRGTRLPSGPSTGFTFSPATSAVRMLALPGGASILTAEVAGEKVKPVEGPDGNRVPLLRPGFRPMDSYNVSFVFIHSGAPFAKKGGSDISL